MGISGYKIQMVDFDISVSRSSHRRCYTRSFKKYHWDQVQAVLQAIPWHLMNTCDSNDDKWIFSHCVV